MEERRICHNNEKLHVVCGKLRMIICNHCYPTILESAEVYTSRFAVPTLCPVSIPSFFIFLLLIGVVSIMHVHGTLSDLLNLLD